MVTQCCVCQKVRQHKDWVDPVEELDPDTVSHGYCPECAAEAFAQIRTWLERDARQARAGAA